MSVARELMGSVGGYGEGMGGHDVRGTGGRLQRVRENDVRVYGRL